MTLTIQIERNTFIMHPTGALFWEDQNALLISDVHLGKVSHFRKHGVAIPGNAVSKNFHQMNKAIEHFKPAKIFFLGDLFHSVMNNEWELFEEWLLIMQPVVILIAGNHDIIHFSYYEKLNVKVHNELTIDNFLLTHHPTDREHFFNFSGHIHPAVLMRGVGRQYLKLPCFFKKPNQMILPAFGEFTGTYYMIPTEHDCVYAIIEDEVIVVC